MRPWTHFAHSRVANSDNTTTRAIFIFGCSAAMIAIVSCTSETDVGVVGTRTGSSELYIATAHHELDGDSIAIALLVDGDHVTAFVCPDDVSGESYPGWFVDDDHPAVSASDRRIRAVNKGWLFTGTWTGEKAEGEIVEPSGEVIRWSGSRVSTTGLTGLYSTYDSGCTTGVIVLEQPQEEQTPPSPSPIAPIVRGTWCDAEDRRIQVTPVLPLELIDGRLAVEVALPHGELRQLYVTPLRTLPLRTLSP